MMNITSRVVSMTEKSTIMFKKLKHSLFFFQGNQLQVLELKFY
jgi:hypothetical protein